MDTPRKGKRLSKKSQKEQDTILCFPSSLLDDNDDNYDNPNAYMYDAVQAEKHRIDKWIHKPMTHMYPGLTILCFDAEGVNGDASEYGFAWYRTSDLISTQSGRNREGWLPHLKAKHFLVDIYKDHPGSRWTDGDPRGFWQKYGKTIIYDPKQAARNWSWLQEQMKIISQEPSPAMRKRSARKQSAPVVAEVFQDETHRCVILLRPASRDTNLSADIYSPLQVQKAFRPFGSMKVFPSPSEFSWYSGKLGDIEVLDDIANGDGSYRPPTCLMRVISSQT